MPGVLYIVGTPIGNLEDITFRAVRILKEVGVIAAEDTRHTQKLLARLDIHTPLTSYHDFNKEEKAKVLVAKLQEGISIALVSDAGTPTISDPGYYLINRSIEANIVVSPIPGPVAAIAALSVSGLPTDRFVFEGFLPKKGLANRLERLRSETRTLIFYESPHRIHALLKAMSSIFGERKVVIAREMTKVFEETIRGDFSTVLARLGGKSIKGEVTLVVEGNRNAIRKSAT